MSEDPVITGLGAVTPAGATAHDTWASLAAGRSAVGPVTAFDAGDLRTRIAAEVRGFDAEAHLGARRARRSARFTQLGIVAAREAVADAGLDVAAASERVAVQLNTAVPGAPEIEAAVASLRDGGPAQVSPFFVPTTIPNMPACEVAIDLGVHGPVNASALACASGVAALIEARRTILAGDADVVLAGGTDAGIAAAMLGGLDNMGPMSRRNDEPERASRPFDADRDGFVFGEGAVVCVVESAAHARTRGARLLGSVAGGALTADAFHISAPDPSGRWATRAIELALQRSDVTPSELDLVVAHGTGTVANDRAEANALRAALGPAADAVAVTSPKSMVGHLIAAAGTLSVLVALSGMRDGTIAPTVNYETPDPECAVDVVATPRSATVRTAIVNAFGFGGQNAVVVLRAP